MLSTGGTLPVPVSPGVWAVYQGTTAPLFKPGQKANPIGIERQAEWSALDWRIRDPRRTNRARPTQAG